MSDDEDFTDEETELLVKLAREAEADDEWWAFAETLDEMLEDGDESPSSHKNNGSYEKLAKLAPRIERETGTKYTVNRLRQIRAVAKAWPSPERDPELSFTVHEHARSPEAKAKLVGYKRRAAADAKRDKTRTPALTIHRLREYRREDRDKVVSWEDQQKQRGKSWAKKALSLAELDGIWDAFAAAIAERRKELGG